MKIQLHLRRLCQVPGIDLNSQDDYGDTAALVAVASLEPDCVKILSTVSGIDWNQKNYSGNSPITVAIDKGSVVEITSHNSINCLQCSRWLEKIHCSNSSRK